MKLSFSLPDLKPWIFLFVGLLGICVLSYASTSTTTMSIVKEVQKDWTINIKTIYNTVTVHSVADIKNTLEVTSSANEKKLFDLIQEYRLQQKKPIVLKYSSKIADVGRVQAKYLSDNNILSHLDAKWGTAWDRIFKAGFEPSYWGEAAGEAKDVYQVFETFKKSKDHNAILLNDLYTIVWVGYYQGKWVVDFYKDTKMQYADKESVTKPSLIRSKKKF